MPASAVTACLLSWKRPEQLAAVVQSLHGLDFVDEILVWNNAPDVDLRLPGDKTEVIRSDENAGCYGRFLCAARARNEIVYVQDDDVLVGNVEALYRCFLADPSRIAHALSPAHYAERERHVHGACHVALLGWGAFFRRDWTGVLDALPEAVRASALFRREADKYFSILLERHHQSVRGELRHIGTHSTPGVALWRSPDHTRLKARAVRDALRRVRLRRDPSAPAPWHVVVPCHDYARFLGAAVGSALDNDADLEVTIVDDASTDDTAEVAAALAERDACVHVVRQSERRGPAAALNRALRDRPSDFVVALDADDRIGPDYLAAARRVLDAGADVANPDAHLFGTRQGRWEVPPCVTYAMLGQRNFVHCAAAYRRSLWAACGGYDEAIPGWQDYEFWIRAAAAGARIRRVEGRHFFYRKHGASRAANSHAIREQLRTYLSDKHPRLFRTPAGAASGRGDDPRAPPARWAPGRSDW